MVVRAAPGTELLDDPSADPAAVRTSLGNIARANRWFGGTAAILHGLERVLRPGWGPVTVLDLGTGAGDIPAAIRAWGDDRWLAIRTVGLDRLRPAAKLARSRDLPMVLGCATRLPLRDRSVDVVTLSQVLHHFDHDGAVRILTEARRVARQGIVVADLLRSRTAAALFAVGARALGFDRHTITDGVTSVERGYTADELRAIAEGAGLCLEVTVRPGWRVVAWGRGR